MDLQALFALVLATNSALARKDASFARIDFKPNELTNPFFEIGELEFRWPGSVPKSFGDWVAELVGLSAASVRVLSTTTYHRCGLLVTLEDSTTHAWLTHAAVDQHGYGTLVEDDELGAWADAPSKCVFVAKSAVELASGTYDLGSFEELGAPLLEDLPLDAEWEGRMRRIVQRLLPVHAPTDYSERTRTVLSTLLYASARGGELLEHQISRIHQTIHAPLLPGPLRLTPR